jgi:plastocyanin
MKLKALRVPVLVLAVGLVAAACSSNSSTTPSASGTSGQPSSEESSGQPSPEESSGTITINGEQANDHGTKDASGMTEVSVELGDEFYFEPTILKGTPGQQLSVELESEDTLTHNFSLEAQNISQDVAGGLKATVAVTFPQSGNLLFFCRFHRNRGMIGELSV